MFGKKPKRCRYCGGEMSIERKSQLMDRGYYSCHCGWVESIISEKQEALDERDRKLNLEKVRGK